MADAGASIADDDDLYEPPGAGGKTAAGRDSRSRKGNKAASGVARRSSKVYTNNSGDLSDATDSGLYGLAAVGSMDFDACADDAVAAAAASKSKQDRLKEKNRLAQRRFRARQKTMLEQMQVRMDELAKQVGLRASGTFLRLHLFLRLSILSGLMSCRWCSWQIVPSS